MFDSNVFNNKLGIVLAAATPFTVPDDLSGISTIQPYDESTLSFAVGTSVTIEFDYGNGFNESFVQTVKNASYKSPACKKFRLTATDATEARLTAQKPIGGL